MLQTSKLSVLGDFALPLDPLGAITTPNPVWANWLAVASVC